MMLKLGTLQSNAETTLPTVSGRAIKQKNYLKRVLTRTSLPFQPLPTNDAPMF